MKRIIKYLTFIVLSVTFLYAACNDGITPPPYDGPWEKVPVPEGIGCNNLWFTGPNDGWVSGGGTIGHYDGNEWKIVKDFDKETEKYYLGDIIARSPTDVWTCGRAERAETDYNGFIAHYDGTDWEIQHFQDFGWLSALWFFDDGTGWAGGGYGLMRYDGGNWEFYQESYSVGKFYFNNKNEGWYITDFHIFEWNGTEWTEVLKAEGDTWLYDIDFAAPDDGWAVGHLESYHYDGTEWGLYNPLYKKDFDALCFLNEDFGWGINGKTYYYDGSTWTEYDDGYGYSKYDVFCVSEGDVWIASSGGYFLHFSGF